MIDHSAKIAELVGQWRDSLVGVDKTEPDRNHHWLIFLLAEQNAEIMRRLEFFNGHVHRSTGSGKATQTGPPIPRTW